MVRIMTGTDLPGSSYSYAILTIAIGFEISLGASVAEQVPDQTQSRRQLKEPQSRGYSSMRTLATQTQRCVQCRGLDTCQYYGPIVLV